eukprot:15370524-Heterocapsa_arctica.AAC.1
MSSSSSPERMSSHNVDSMSSMTDPDDEDSETDEAPGGVNLEGAPRLLTAWLTPNLRRGGALTAAARCGPRAARRR